MMVRLILRRRWLLASALLLGILLCTIQTLTEPQRYTGAASLRVGDDGMIQKLLQERPTGAQEERDTPAPAEVKTRQFADLMQDTRDGGFVHDVLRSADLKRSLPLVVADPAAATTGEGTKPNPRLRQLMQSISVSTESPEVLSIHLTWDDQKECEDLLDAFRDRFIMECGRRRQVETIAIREFQNAEIHNVERDLKKLEELQLRQELEKLQHRQAGSTVSAGALSAERGVTALQVRREALQEHLKDLHLQRLRWMGYANAQSVAASSILIPQNNIDAEPVVTPSRMLAEAPGRLLRCTLLSLVLVLAGAALRQILLRRRKR